MCKQLARHGKQSYPSIIAALPLGSFSFIQRDYDALVPGHHCHCVGCTLDLDRYRILLVPCLP